MPLVSVTRRHIVFALDQSISMDHLDPERLRIEGLRKLLYGLSPTDQVGLVLFGDAARIAVPLAPASSANMGALLREANAPSAVTGSPDLNRAMQTSLGMLPKGVDGVISSVILISSARMPEGMDEEAVKAATIALRRSTYTFIRANADLYAIALGPFSDKALALTSVMRSRTNQYEVETGNGLPQVFGKILVQVQGYGQRPVLARLDPEAASVDKQELVQAVRVAPYTELLQIDIVSESDQSGVIGFAVALKNPEGDIVPPTFQSSGNAFYRIPGPMAGEWQYGVKPERKARITHQVITDTGLKIVHYYPSVVEVGKAIDLYSSVLTRQGPVEVDSFKVGTVDYQFAQADVTFVGPDGTSETIRAQLEGRRSVYAGEYKVTNWRGDVPGAYDVDIAIYLRKEKELHGDLFEMHNIQPITIHVVDDRSQLPLVSLASVDPVSTDGRPIPLFDAQGRAPQLSFYAEVLERGVGGVSPYMLGRTIIARVKRGDGYELTGDVGQATLTGYKRPVGPPSLLLEPDTTVARRVQYAFPTLNTSARDKVYFEQAGYYRVQLIEGPTYRVDAARASVVRQVGDEPLSSTAIVMLALGGLVAVFGGALYLLIEWGKIDLAPRGAGDQLDDVLIEDEPTFTTFTDVFDENLFDMPQNIPLEIAVFEHGMLTNHTTFDTERSENYVVKVLRGSAYINGSPVTDEFDLHMRPEDEFQVGDFKAGISGVEDLVIQFMVEDVGESTVINVITDTGVQRWTITSAPELRVPPRPGETRTLDFSEQDELLIARDEGLDADHPMDIALYHESVGAPHAKFTKQTYLNGSVGYGVEAIRGSLYVNDRRLEPEEVVEEFSPGTTIKIGRFTFKYNWDQGPDAQHPVLEFLEAPEATPLPITDIHNDPPADVAEETDAATVDEEALDALFDDGDGPSEDEDDDSTADGESAVDAVADIVDDDAAPAEEGALDEMFAAPAEGEVPVADPVPDADEAALDLDALLADDETEGDEPGEDVDAGAPGEAPTLDALVGDEPGPEGDVAEEAPQAETADETADALTGLPTSEGFADRLNEDWAAAEAADLPMSMVLVDVTRIASDGDESAATEVARVLSSEFAAVGTPSHAGEHLLALVLTNVPLDEAIEVAGLVQTALGGAFPDSSEGISMGVSERRGSRAEDAAGYLRSLREAMDEGVAAGQNFVVYG
ncbi:VWA domain-containing protein [Candidatus Poribacteria bacterium]|nr:VWA domain-containing protein [Candidatus Poribacteria bacterium]MBT5532960.1 VWA domain-containing protein [Candidatus Poribacteria bacterium]MBT5712026.1 VWA domain-containing protein [Candidatus Poribacteria bacterium]MBT7098177.1 VWA domain-containing protein [Candidatus Poribacteria bacterium]MBT7805720.1 VWA domain-containing protein [Candidatus Poribacteria bacterium]